MNSSRRPRLVLARHLRELQTSISKMAIQDCCVQVTPEFGLSWSEISRAVRKLRLPMTSSSVASVLCKFAVKSLSEEEVAHIAARLRLKLVALKARNWYLINLTEQTEDIPVNTLIQTLPTKLKQALRNGAFANKKYQVHTIKLGDLIFMSVQNVTQTTTQHEGSVLYVASPPGQPIALVSSLHSNMLRACVHGLGYKRFEDGGLNGRDVNSLLRIANGGLGPSTSADIMMPPQLNAEPRAVRGGYDFTNSQALKEHLARRLGPDPPVLETLQITTSMAFHDPAVLDDKMKAVLQIHSNDVLSLICKWCELGVIPPDSKLIDIISDSVKYNKINMDDDDDDDD